jgi:hypothetical protein
VTDANSSTATAKGFATGTALALFMRTFYPPPGPWSSAVLPLSMRVFTIFALDLFFPTGLVLAGIAVRFRAARARRWDVESALALLSQVALFPVMVYTVTDIGRMLLLGVPWIAGLAWEAAMDGVKWVQLAGAEYGYDLEFGSTFGSGFGDAAAHLRWTGLVARLESVKDMVVAQWNTSLGRAGVRDLAEEFEMFYVAFPEAVAIEAAAAAAVVAEVLPVASAFEFEAVPNSAAEQLAVPTRLEL